MLEWNVKRLELKKSTHADKTGPFYNMKPNAMFKFKTEKEPVKTDLEIS